MIKTVKLDPEVFTIGGTSIRRGERKRISLEAAALYDTTKLTIPVEVIRGKKAGPVLFISAAVHGDEINGVEVIRRLLKKSFLKNISGTLILIPIVNVFGFNYKSRYLPDRRDLNRSFPGSKNGSLASQIAYVFSKEIITKCSYGIDLHTGANHRTNLPHIRASLGEGATKTLAESFGVPVVVNSALRDGSLREYARRKNVSMLLFEGGEALRFEERVISIGLRGCISVMKNIGMLKGSLGGNHSSKMYISEVSFWLRAPRSGTFSAKKKIGDKIKPGDVLAIIADPFGQEECQVISDKDGILIGATLLPLVNRGDAMFHIATFNSASNVAKALKKDDIFHDQF